MAVLMTFCMDDMPGEYMAGLGSVENCPDRQSAITEANLIAIFGYQNKVYRHN